VTSAERTRWRNLYSRGARVEVVGKGDIATRSGT
jgi:hypothetical protein